MTSYAQHLNPEAAPQSEPIPGREAEMAKNRAGGYVFALDSWKQLERFLILGAEGNTYYAAEREMVLENARVLQACIAADGPGTVAVVHAVDHQGRAPKRAPLLFALAIALTRGNAATKQSVVEAVPDVIRTASDLFSLLATVRELKGRGQSWWASRSVRRVIAAWYNAQEPETLAYQLAKYRSRVGFTHRDALRLGHPKPAGEERAALMKWAIAGGEPPEGDFANILRGFRQAEVATETDEVARIVEAYRLTWEMVPSDHLRAPEVWAALLPHMPYRALLRNLGRMGSIGLIKPLSGPAAQVAERLADVEALRRARVHPISVLSALMTYRRGAGVRGSLKWEPAAEVMSSLEAAFEASFTVVEPTGQRYYLALDVSGSMSFGEIAGAPGLTPAAATAALAMVTARKESRHVIRGFAETLRPLPITASSSFTDAMKAVSGLAFGRTDCSAPILDALKSGMEVDVFVVLTDNETWAGTVHPKVALDRYRQKTGINARLAVVGMESNGFTIADPKDPGMLDMVGFDAAGPQILRDFALGML